METAPDNREKKGAEEALRESEERLRLKLDSVTVPGTDIGEPALGDIIDVPSLQSMVDEFHKLNGMGVWILDLKGTVLVGVGWQDICTKYHRVHPQTARNCTESDLYLNQNMRPGEYVAYKCKNGMTDVVTPLHIGGKHVGNIYTGQFFYKDEDVDVGYFAAQAAQCGFEPEPYLEALRRVPRFSRESVRTLMDFLVKFTTLVSKMGYNHLQLTKAMGDQKRVQDALRKAHDSLEIKVQERTAELVKANADLRQSEARFKRLYDADIIGVIFWDTAGNITGANREFLRIVGYTEEDVLSGRARWKDMTPPEYAPLDEKALKQMAKTGAAAPFEKEYIRKNGSHVPVVIGATLFKGAKDVGICFVLDITERKRAEEALKKANEDLERSNQELEQFAYVASHDLQEPLRMVASYTQLLAKRYQDQLDQDAREFIGFAVDGANRMQRLINDLLTYSRVQTRGKPSETTDSHAALGEALVNLASAIEESGGVVTNDDLPAVRADPGQLVQIFQNLVGNGLKFRGEVPPHVHVSARDTGREWLFSVRDNGIGIEPQYFARLFVIFQRLHGQEQYPGTGIGLALCRRIITRHGGRIWLESEAGKGSTFHFTLPK